MIIKENVYTHSFMRVRNTVNTVSVFNISIPLDCDLHVKCIDTESGETWREDIPKLLDENQMTRDGFRKYLEIPTQDFFNPFNETFEDLETLPRKDFSFHAVKARLNRRKDNFVDLVNANLCDGSYFFTFTYDTPNACYVDDLKKSNFNFTKFIMRLRYQTGINIKYVVVPELQKKYGRNAWHYHAIFFGCGRLDINLVRETWGLGAVNVKRIRTIGGCAKYMAKYMTKCCDVTQLYSKSYFSSRNLNRSKIQYDIKDIDFSKYELVKTTTYDSFWTGNTTRIDYVLKKEFAEN